MSLLLPAILLAACSGDRDAETAAAGAAMPDAAVDSLWRELDALEHRRQLVEDSDDIKRLQRAYGYYLDHALWDEVADLFAADASLEIGLDGVYIGQERIREYFATLGGGQNGLSHGQLNEHMQLMPVVTVAPDGMTAQARWRDIIMAGQLGDHAVWGEGPFENEYVKEDGVWKLSKLHWFQTMLVPYEGGWHQNVDFNGGKWVSDQLPPDAPTTFAYEAWPGTFQPPFHFDNPVLGAVAVDLGQYAPARQRDDTSLAALAREAAMLERRVQLIEDENEIENLQRIYGFYIEEGFWSEAADLFTDDAVLEVPGSFPGSGIFRGKDRIRAYYQSIDAEFPQPGRLYDQMQLQPIVHVAPDGQSAKARWRLFAQEARHGEFAEWGVGWYENDYVKEDGVWKIAHQRTFLRMYTPDAQGWGQAAADAPSFRASLEPDAPSDIEHALYPVVPDPHFHYSNPVTGTPVYSTDDGGRIAAPMFADSASARAFIEQLADRVERIEDIEQIERLQGVYGYYLARYEMDDLAGIFSDDGTIEIALRGVYEGKASVRRNLDLYPPVDLHNHMQYQPVIHLDEDGDSARMRSRALSIMGSYDQYSMWMGGIYENEFVEEDGIWKLRKDQVFNTYFINYGEGWRNNQPRQPPGISTDNPPDSPPTIIFEMYPSAFLPPYHYANPVTGARVDWQPDAN
ncbi:MAG: nuclear transport factor 2 family protein [Gammaproteobacteria bacterium]|nr:nuclear transport factor 2 family protein [Gammaproteobacteria bacterium]